MTDTAKLAELIVPQVYTCDQPSVNEFISRDMASEILDAYANVREIAGIPCADAAAYAEAGTRYATLQSVRKAVEEKRVKVKAPALAFIKTLDAEAKRIDDLLDAEMKRIGGMLLTYKRLDDERIAKIKAEEKAAAEKLQREAEEAAEKERQRLQDEADALHRAKLAAIEEGRKAAEDAGEDPMPVDLPPAPVVQVLVEQPRAIVPRSAAPAAVKSFARSAPTYRLVIDKREDIPREINGQPLWILDEALCLKLGKLITIPGLHVESSDGVAPTGRR